MISDRIEALITHFCKGNKSLFAQQIGVTPSVIGNITGERKGNPSFEVIQKVLDAFASVNPDWFILDRGPMLRDSKTSEETKWSSTPIATPVSPAEESIIYKMYEKEKEENKALIRENGRLEERIRQLESQDKEPERHPAMDEVTEDFISKPSGDYGEDYSPTKPHTTSKRLSAGKI